MKTKIDCPGDRPRPRDARRACNKSPTEQIADNIEANAKNTAEIDGKPMSSNAADADAGEVPTYAAERCSATRATTPPMSVRNSGNAQ